MIISDGAKSKYEQNQRISSEWDSRISSSKIFDITPIIIICVLNVIADTADPICG